MDPDPDMREWEAASTHVAQMTDAELHEIWLDPSSVSGKLACCAQDERRARWWERDPEHALERSGIADPHEHLAELEFYASLEGLVPSMHRAYVAKRDGLARVLAARQAKHLTQSMNEHVRACEAPVPIQPPMVTRRSW